jgi:hypothetical protein
MMQLHDDELDQEKRPNQDALLQQLAAPGLQAPAGGFSSLLPEGVSPQRNNQDLLEQSGSAGLKIGNSLLQGMAQPSQKRTSNPDYMNWAGINREKYDSAHDSPKYQILRELSKYDPSQGVTADVLAGLNALGLGTFTGQKDKINVGGQIDPRFEGYTEFDLIRGFNDPNNQSKKWGFGGTGAPGQPDYKPQGGQGGGMGLGIAQGGLHSLLSGDPMAGIQAAIGQYAGQGDNLKALLAQLQGGR